MNSTMSQYINFYTVGVRAADVYARMGERGVTV